MKSVALPFGDGSVQVQLPDRTQVVKASQPNARIAPAVDEAKAVSKQVSQTRASRRRLTRPRPFVLPWNNRWVCRGSANWCDHQVGC
jgi:hypothetical protein